MWGGGWEIIAILGRVVIWPVKVAADGEKLE